MSRSTRSGVVYNDENAAGAIMHGKIGLKNQLANHSITQPIKARAALGDISNRAGFGGIGGKDKDGVKKFSRIPVRVAPTINQSVLPPTTRSNAQINQPINQSIKHDDPMETDESEDYVMDQSIIQPITQPLPQQQIAQVKPLVNDHSINHSVAIQSIDQSIHAFDLAHARNAQYVLPYVNDIMAHWREIEPIKQPSCNYLQNQSDLSPRMREILIDWLNEVHSKFRLSCETLYLCIYLLDQYLSKTPCKRTCLQLAGCAALLLAAKYEEIFAPECSDFVTISDHSFRKDALLTMEAQMLNSLSFSLTTVSPLRFLHRWQQLISVHLDSTDLYNQSINQSIIQSHEWTLNHCSEFLLELTLQDYRFLQYFPSMLAASCLFLSAWLHSGIQGKNAWKSINQSINYEEQQIITCVQDLCATANNQSKYRAVRKKYSDVKYGRVGLIDVTSPFQ